MNQEFFTLNQQDLETLLSKGHCSCHFINPNKTRIILWKEIKDDTEIYYLRIGIQKFISQEQIDRNGEMYWRYYSPETKKDEEKPEVKSEVQTEIDPITKFNQRQEQTKDYAKSNSEQSVNSQSS